MQSQGHVVHATYTGIVPDTFKDDAEVVLKGVLGPDGFEVHPNGVMAKCPSKYEAKVGAAGAAGAARPGRPDRHQVAARPGATRAPAALFGKGSRWPHSARSCSCSPS